MPSKRSSARSPLKKKRPKDSLPKSLKNRRVLLGVTGSVAAYKAIELTRRLKDEGVAVSVVMTEAATRFVTALSLQLASGEKVHTGMFDDPLSHISLPKEADVMLVAPATANTIAKFANGFADDLLGACYLAFKGTLILAPAMNSRMYESPAFGRNLKRLLEDGAILVPPEKGTLACGEEGVGRMACIEKIIETVKTAIGTKGVGDARRDLEGEKILVTAGPTREYMDKVRFISNPSTGKMGYAIAKAAKQRGAEVTLISGPSALEPPSGVNFVSVETTKEMRDAVLGALNGSSAVIMAAAPADFSPAVSIKGKVEKESMTSLKLRQTPDILSEIGALKNRPFIVGFAAEAGEDIKRARKKLVTKNADIIVLNDITRRDAGFGADTNKVTIIDKKGAGLIRTQVDATLRGDSLRADSPGRTSSAVRLPLMTKDEVAEAILDRVAANIKS